jgi:murein DD-endopeptidase MepM/ murein hydrolase activator NlpD
MSRVHGQTRRPWPAARGALLAGLGAWVALQPGAAAAGGEPFEYMPPGALVAGSGQGRVDETVYAPGMRFPIETGPAFANSQVWGTGGSQGPGGSQCSAVNYDYPWRDNYCETRQWTMPMCPSGTGHQGQDIRPATCENGVHWTAAADAGVVTSIGSYSVYVTAADGTRYDYLHGSGNAVAVGQAVAREQRINRVSNQFGGTPTTIHLHFNIRQDVAGFGVVYAPTYMSLVTSYQELFGLVNHGQGAVELESSGCTAMVGWAQGGEDPEAAATVLVAFDGPQDDPGATVIEVLADRPRPDLCEALGSCDHGYEVEVPLRLRDTSQHEARFYVVGSGGAPVELEGSPLPFACEPPPLPAGVRRSLESPEVMAAWAFSPLYQVAWAPADVLAARPAGNAFPERPVLVVSDGDPAPTEARTRWVMDPGYKRRVSSEAIASAWGLAWDEAEEWPAEVLDTVPEGTPLRPAPFLVTSDEGIVVAIDDEQCPLTDDGQLDPGCEPEGHDDTAGDTTEGGEGTLGTAGDGDGTGGVPVPPGADADDAGCQCRSDGSRGAGSIAWWSLLLLAVRRRRG